VNLWLFYKVQIMNIDTDLVQKVFVKPCLQKASL